MKAILTVIGHDRVGIVYRIAKHCSEQNINILDINQTVMDQFFTMVVLVDYTEAPADVAALQEGFQNLASELGLSIKFQSEEIFNAMYTV